MLVYVCIFIKRNDDNLHSAIVSNDHSTIHWQMRTKAGQLAMGGWASHRPRMHTMKVQCCYFVGWVFGPTVKFDCIACFACIIYLVINWMTSNGLINPLKSHTYTYALHAYKYKTGLMLCCCCDVRRRCWNVVVALQPALISLVFATWCCQSQMFSFIFDFNAKNYHQKHISVSILCVRFRVAN